jgi:hypothetical protein
MPVPTATQEAPHTPFHPRAVALIGASGDTTRHGCVVLTSLRNAGFTDGIFAETLRDAATFPLPSSHAFVEQDVVQFSLGHIRASPPTAYPGVFAAVIDLLISLQAALAPGDRIRAIDINHVTPGESGASAVRALLEPIA